MEGIKGKGRVQVRRNFDPHPALRATLSQRERDSFSVIPYLITALLILLSFLPGSAQSKPMRVVSTTLATDEILIGLVEPARIAAISLHASDPQISNIADTARKINSVADRDAEKIVRLQPDLIFSTRYTKVDLKFLMQHAQIPYVELQRFEAISDIESNIRTAARALHEERRGEEVVREMRRKLDLATQQTNAARRSWRVLYLAPGNWTAGTKTSVHELIRNANLKNAAEEAGIVGHNKISPETIIQLDPDVILIGTGYARDDAFRETLIKDQRFSTLSSIRKNRILAIPSRYVLTTSQFIADGSMELGKRINALP